VKLPDLSAITPEQMREITAECRAQLLIARKRERENAPQYRVQAEWFKTLAASTHLPKVQASRFRIATSYERPGETCGVSIRPRRSRLLGAQAL
jgi:hypothetical protein